MVIEREKYSKIENPYMRKDSKIDIQLYQLTDVHPLAKAESYRKYKNKNSGS